MAGRAEHHGVARRAPAETVRGGVLMVVGLDLDDPAADAVDEEFRPDQIRRNVVHASRKEGAAEEGRLGHLGMRCRSEPGWMV